MSRTWKDNAHEFDALTVQGYGVRLAVLAACSVEKGTAGRPPGNARARAISSRVSVREFAREAGVSENTVRSYLNKWDRMVAIIKADTDKYADDASRYDRANLTPADVERTDWVRERFVRQFDALATEGASGLTGKAADVAKNVPATLKALEEHPEFARRIVEGLSDRAMTTVRHAMVEEGSKRYRQMYPGGKVDLSGELGFDPDLVLEVSRMHGNLSEYRRRVTRCMDMCKSEEDREWVRGQLLPVVEDLMATLVPVPNTVEGLM